MLFSSVLLLSSCLSTVQNNDDLALAGMDVRLTILHTSDIHSRLIPYYFEPSFTDAALGLNPDNGPFGGIAKISSIVKEQRQKRGVFFMWILGILFKALSFLIWMEKPKCVFCLKFGLNAAVLANHESDNGARIWHCNMVSKDNFRCWQDIMISKLGICLGQPN